ncbi:hypothetical protein CI1B_38080 [Bradyrhizobium ivorense]|uniref:Uncharacterized protein n=1 Tax=Bradyrhizobium ivorense TaxID=2511166 RepID=A0A508TBK1_9BRAD|nr:hypothetical protein CI1B_38080 [Bradyrhizobium ivorense]
MHLDPSRTRATARVMPGAVIEPPRRISSISRQFDSILRLPTAVVRPTCAAVRRRASARSTPAARSSSRASSTPPAPATMPPPRRCSARSAMGCRSAASRSSRSPASPGRVSTPAALAKPRQRRRGAGRHQQQPGCRLLHARRPHRHQLCRVQRHAADAAGLGRLAIRLRRCHADGGARVPEHRNRLHGGRRSARPAARRWSKAGSTWA